MLIRYQTMGNTMIEQPNEISQIKISKTKHFNPPKTCGQMYRKQIYNSVKQSERYTKNGSRRGNGQ